MPKWTTIDELRNLFINKYVKSDFQSELEKACSEEFELKRDYNGRQILELLQNVDDACDEKKPDDEVIVNISFKNNILEVGNTGTKFSAETIERLCLGRASEKSSNKIGNKGTGFRSLLNDAEWIEIHSGKYSIRFSETYTKNIFDPYIDKKSPEYSSLIDEQKNNWKKDYPFCFPIMNCPEPIKPNSKGFDTLIRVKVKEENEKKETSIKKQLEQPFYKSLLFLPNITVIRIENDSEIKEYSKIPKDNLVTIQEKLEKENPTKIAEYYLFTKIATINSNEADLMIAIPKEENYDFSNEKLYCYFPIRNFTTPIHALIHAPFLTNNSRDDVPNDETQINKKIFSSILLFIKEISEKLATLQLRDLSIQTVVPVMDSKLWEFDTFNLLDEYYEILSSAKILPTVNNKFISVVDSPKIIQNDFPEEFKGKDFNELLIELDDETLELVIKLADFIDYTELEYEESELAEKINKISQKSDIKTRIKLFLWCNDYFKSYYNFPQLLKDTKDNWITETYRIYLPTDKGISILPNELSWVKLCILKQEYVSELIYQLKKDYSLRWQKAEENSSAGGDKRTLATYSRENFRIVFIEQSSHEQIISTINQQIETFEESRAFINWFFEKYGKDLTEGSELSKVHFYLPDNNHEIKSITELYLGKDYGNPLADKLFENTSISPIANLKDIYIGQEEKEFITFLKKCEILIYPKIVSKSLIEKRAFRNYVSDNYVRYIIINYLKSYTIENIETLVQNLTTKEIIEWITKDESLRNLILSEDSYSTANQQSNWSDTHFASNAYIKYILNTTPWIDFNGTKYAPSKIIKYDKIKDKLPDYYGASEQELIKKLGKLIVNSYELDFKESLAEIPDTDIKKLLTLLPNFDKGEISRKLYLEIIKYKKDKSPHFSTSDIEVLCKDNKFHSNKEVKYADRKISKTEETNGNFIYIQPKQSTETIQAWFGVERYKTSLKLLNPITLKNTTEFENEVRDIKIAFLCCIDSNKTNVDKIKRIEIVPCSEIEVKDSEQENKQMFLEDYFFIEDNNSYYLKLPSNYSIVEMRQSDLFSLSIIDMFKQSLTLSLEEEASFLELLISKDTINKRRKIEDVFGIDKWNTSYELLYNRKIVNEDVLKFFTKNKLNSELKKEISTIDFSNTLDKHDYECLINSLKEVSKDIKDLNNSSELLNLNLIPYYEEEMKKLMDSEFDKYRLNLYYDILANQLDKSKHYLEMLEEYRNFDTSKFCFSNTVSIDLSECLNNQFQLLNNGSDKSINPDESYNNNVKKICNQLNITTYDFDYYIQNKSENKSILYFTIPDEIYNSIKEFLNQAKQNTKNEAENNPDNRKSSTIKTKLKNSGNHNSGNHPKGNKGEKSSKDYEHRSQLNDKSGKTAEEIAYNELKKTFKSLIWHSKYSSIPADRNRLPPDGIVCDMWNADSINGNTYFEIKSSTTEFDMTINEYESMKQHRKNYEVILVNRETQEISHHKFDELDVFKEVNGYKFRFEQEIIK